MPQTECLAIQDTLTGLWLIAVNSDGTYSWGNPDNAICFPTEELRQDVLNSLGDTERFAKGRPGDRQPK
ncbi:MAG: hypothetical protein V4538_15310 [Bacteroidota bacterium]